MMASNEERSLGTVPRVLLVVAGCLLVAGGAALAVAFGARQGNWANAVVFALPPALLGCALLHVSRRPRRWPLAVAAALLVVLVPAGMLLWFSANHYGSEPEYEVGSLQELRDDLSVDCPGIRYPNLDRCEGEGTVTCKVLYRGGRLTMRYRSYWIVFERFDTPSGGDAASGGQASPAALSVLSRDLRAFDGGEASALQVRRDMSLSGVDVERDGGALRFVIGDYLYEVSAGGRTPEGRSTEAHNGQLYEAAREVALSIIDL